VGGYCLHGYRGYGGDVTKIKLTPARVQFSSDGGDLYGFLKPSNTLKDRLKFAAQEKLSNEFYSPAGTESLKSSVSGSEFRFSEYKAELEINSA
jgi:hypothetical protein